jgi:hypothetical protein
MQKLLVLKKGNKSIIRLYGKEYELEFPEEVQKTSKKIAKRK